MISIILMEPQYQGNIGSVARAMKNFGLKELCIVNAKVEEEARIMAVHAKDVLENAKHYKTFDEFKKDFDYLVATSDTSTGKDDYFLRMSLPLEELKEKLDYVDGKIGIVFGREADGLSNEEIEKCSTCVRIPTSEEYSAMNLSHSVAVVAYELGKSKYKSKEIRIASKKEIDLIENTLEEITSKIGHPEKKAKVFNTMIKRIIGRAVLTGREANTLIGVLKEIKKSVKKK